MFTLKEKREVKNILKKYDMYSKDMLRSVNKIYDGVKQYSDEVLYATMYERKNPVFYLNVKTVLAYKELKETSDNYTKYEREFLSKKKIVAYGNTVECTVVDFNECPFNLNCDMMIRIVDIYEELKSGFKTNGAFINTIMMVILNILAIKHEKWKMEEGASSIKERVKKIKAAEEAYGVKFFVNDYLYDTFMHPELFESYGVYKNNDVFRMNKENIIQDRL